MLSGTMMHRSALAAALLPCAFAPLAGRSAAQELSVLDASLTRWITQEVSGDAAYEHVRFMTTTYHRPNGGSDGLMKVAQYYEAKAHELGRTSDWVVLYFHDTDHREAQRTVVTETHGPLEGLRVIRGHEAACATHYAATAAAPEALSA